MTISLRQFRYFIATAEAGQVSQAAMDLRVSQSAITSAIKGIEGDLGIRLFDRHGHGMALTYDGNQFLHRARNVMTAVEEAARLPSRDNAAIEGTIRLAVSYTVAGYFLPAFLSRFSRSFPNIELRLVEADREQIEEGIMGGTYDLAMMLTSNLINQEDIVIETLIRSRRRLWLHSEHEFVERSHVSLQDVADEPYVMLTVDEASNTALRYWNQTPYRPNTIFRTSSVEAVRSLVANGMGITILSDMVYRPWSLEGRRLEVRALTDSIPDLLAGLAWSRNVDRSDAALAFCDFMHLAMGGSQPAIAPRKP